MSFSSITPIPDFIIEIIKTKGDKILDVALSKLGIKVFLPRR